MPVLVDTNVLVDLAVSDPEWVEWSRTALGQAFYRGLVINPIVFSEFSVRYETYDAAMDALDLEEFQRENLPWEAAFAAGQAFRLYRMRGGRRDKVLPDFLIGAHAAVRGYSVLTRDPAGYRTYFPGVEIIAPDTHP